MEDRSQNTGPAAAACRPAGCDGTGSLDRQPSGFSARRSVPHAPRPSPADGRTCGFIRRWLHSLCHAGKQWIRRWMRPDHGTLATHAALDPAIRLRSLIQMASDEPIKSIHPVSDGEDHQELLTCPTGRGSRLRFDQERSLLVIAAEGLSILGQLRAEVQWEVGPILRDARNWPYQPALAVYNLFQCKSVPPRGYLPKNLSRNPLLESQHLTSTTE